MKWKIKTEPEYYQGQTRERFPFAWKPTEINGYMVWLECYWIVEEYSSLLDTWTEIKRGFAYYYP